jgi:hypothetical protein
MAFKVGIAGYAKSLDDSLVVVPSSERPVMVNNGSDRLILTKRG